MNNNNQNSNVYDFIDEQIAELLVLVLTNEQEVVNILDVIDVLCEISNLIPEIVIDGDEMVKYFNNKTRKR